MQIHHFLFTECKRSLGQGNIFRSICQSFCPQGRSGCYGVTSCYGEHHRLNSTPPRQHPHDSTTHPLGIGFPSFALDNRMPNIGGNFIIFFNSGIFLILINIFEGHILYPNRDFEKVLYQLRSCKSCKSCCLLRPELHCQTLINEKFLRLETTTVHNSLVLLPPATVVVERKCFHKCVSLPPATKLGQGNIFRRMWQEFCPQGGVCMKGRHAWQGDMHGKGGMHGKGVMHGGCMAGAMHGRAACMAGGHA